MKQCNKCSVDLVVGENWYASQQKRCNYKCNLCHAVITNKSPNRKLINKKYNQTPNRKKSDIKYLEKTKAGVYGIFSDCKLIYIGQSKSSLERSAAHFSKRKDLKQAKIMSNVSYALSIGELQRETLTFKMLELIDDPQLRLDKEAALIQRYKPIYNDLYV